MARYSELGMYKKDALKAARDFHYPPAVIKKIELAKTESEISRIMATARRERFS